MYSVLSMLSAELVSQVCPLCCWTGLHTQRSLTLGFGEMLEAQMPAENQPAFSLLRIAVSGCHDDSCTVGGKRDLTAGLAARVLKWLIISSLNIC